MIRFVIDMNLSPEWVDVFQSEGYTVFHWKDIGNVKAPDSKIMEWARKNKFVVFTHDFDFGHILAATKTDSPSVIQVRTQDVMPEHLGTRLIEIIRKYEMQLQEGVLITIDENKHRIRILPIK